MFFKKGCKLYVRIDNKIGEKNITDKDFQDHLIYVKNIAKERYFLGGSFLNINGGMILCEAKDLQEAQKIAYDDPIIQRGLYRCDIFEWELFVLSEDTDNKQ